MLCHVMLYKAISYYFQLHITLGPYVDLVDPLGAGTLLVFLLRLCAGVPVNKISNRLTALNIGTNIRFLSNIYAKFWSRGNAMHITNNRQHTKHYF